MKNKYSASELTINLAAIGKNYRTLCKKAQGTKVASVVKANAYGLGVAKVAPVLAKEGCRDFFVATIDEAIELRRILQKENIYAFNGAVDKQQKLCRKFNIIPVLNSMYQVNIFRQYSETEGEKTSVAIHLDTGMNRLGIRREGEIEELAENYKAWGLDIKFIMSHLSCADEKNHPMNKSQLQTFKEYKKLFAAKKLSLANSAGIFLGKNYHFDMVRPGISLYGGKPNNSCAKNPMKNVARLTSRVLQIEQIDRKGAVGYGATHSLAKGAKIATVAVGYADGYLRSLSNRGICYIGDIAVPVVGRVSMDLITLDVSNVPDKMLTQGAEVELIGDNIPVDVVAGKAGTISYEILTSLGGRYKRVYT